MKKKALGKHCGKKVKLLILSNFTFIHNVSYAICTLNPVIDTFHLSSAASLNLGQVSKWCIREWVKSKIPTKTFKSHLLDPRPFPVSNAFATYTMALLSPASAACTM